MMATLGPSLTRGMVHSRRGRPPAGPVPGGPGIGRGRAGPGRGPGLGVRDTPRSAPNHRRGDPPAGRGGLVYLGAPDGACRPPGRGAVVVVLGVRGPGGR